MIAAVAVVVIAIGVLMARGGESEESILRRAEDRFAAADYAAARAALRDAPSSDAKFALQNRIDVRTDKIATALAEIRQTVAHAAELGPDATRRTLERLRDDAPDAPTRAAAEKALRDFAAANAAPPAPTVQAPAPRPRADTQPEARPRRVVEESPPADGLKAKPDRKPVDDAPSGPDPPASKPLSARDAAIRTSIEEARAEAKKGRYRSALEALAMEAAELSADARAPLDAEAAALREASARALEYLLQQGADLERRGKPDEALSLLDDRLDDFPEGTSAELRASIERLGARPSHVAVGAGASSAAAAAATASRASEDTLAREHAQRVAAFVARLSAAIAREPAAFGDLDAGHGRRGAAISADAQALTLQLGAAREPVAWSDLPPATLRALAAKTGGVEPADRLGLALLLDAAHATADADAALKQAVDADPSLQPAVDSILARRRGIDVPAYGFVWHGGRWRTFKERETDKLAARIHDALARLDAAKTPAERDRLSDEIEALGHDATDAMVLALGAKRDELWAQVRATGIAPQLAALEAERAALDAARSHALALIQDEKAYFYPYKPPECPTEKAKLYPAVQEDVDRRVDALRRVWNSKTAVALGAARAPLRLMQEIDARLTAIAGARPADADLERVLATDAEEAAVTLATFARDRKERRALLGYAQRVAIFNAAVATSLTPEERRELALTNEYRAMFGRRALAVNERLVQAARKHSSWMSDYHVFSHFSELPGLRSPFERMRAEGYKSGASENIALAPGPDVAHATWLSSSGHHRNILMPGHTELGVAAAGTYWTQDFGHGDEFRTHSAWRE